MFTPTEKQIKAAENMHTFCKPKMKKTTFDSKEDFNNYFAFLQELAKNKSNNLSNTKKWGQDVKSFNGLKEYAIDYINRYNPTLKQCESHLMIKNPDFSLVWKVMRSVRHLINEAKMAELIVSQMKNSWNSLSEISSKLYRKMFSAEIIEKSISKTNSYKRRKEYTLEEKINFYKSKGLSKRNIFNKYNWKLKKLSSEELNNIIDKVFGPNWELELIKKQVEELKKEKYIWKKIIWILLWKGFRYEDIVSIMKI